MGERGGISFFPPVSMTQKKRRLQKPVILTRMSKGLFGFNDSKEEETTETYLSLLNPFIVIMFQ